MTSENEIIDNKILEPKEEYNDEIADTTLETIDYDDTVISKSNQNKHVYHDNDKLEQTDITSSQDTDITYDDTLKSEKLDYTGAESNSEVDNDDNEDDEDEEGEEGEDEEDEEDEEPPIFKYKRLTKLPPRFFSRDPVSCSFIHEKIFMFATHSGIVLICNPDFVPIKIFKAHTSSILSVDYDGEYFATCSMDGTIIIGCIHEDLKTNEMKIDDSEMVKYDFKRPIHAVALNKPYTKTKSFFCGGTSGNLIHCSKNWLGQRVDNIIDDNGDCITMIKSENDLLVWCNSKGITVGQVSSKNELLHIKVPIGMNRPELYWPKIQFIDKDRILIGWVDHTWYLKIINESKNEGPTTGVFTKNLSSNSSNVLSTAASSFRMHYDEKKVELIYHQKLSDCLIAGISEFNNDLMILNYLPKVGKNLYFPPELKILDGITFDELSVDEVGLNGYKGLGMNDYQLLEYHSEDNNERKWFLICANDAIIIEKFSLHDKLTWYLSKSRYLDAWNLSGFWLDKFEKLKIGKNQINVYINEKNWDEVSEFICKILNFDNVEEFDNNEEKLRYTETVVDEWNNILRIFNDNNVLFDYPHILPSWKFECDKQISEDYYELILHNFLKNGEYNKLIEYIETWDHSLFDLQDIQLHINEILNDFGDEDKDEVRELRRQLINNNLELDEPDNCVNQFIILKDSKLMEFLDEYHLIRKHITQLPMIILIGVNKSFIKEADMNKLKETPIFTNVNILVENSHEILPEEVISLFKNTELEIINYIYLKELSKMDKILIKDFENDLIYLYAKFNKKRLEEFLRKHKKYSIDEAIKVCEKYECNEELVYLLSKIGENKKALTLIIDKMEDPQKAITFVQSINERDLWDYLLDYSMNKSSFIKKLLENVGELVDPIPVVSRIPLGIEIQDLQKSIVNITKNVNLDKNIYEIIMKIISCEYMEKSKKLREIRMMGEIMNDKELDIMRKDIDSCYLKISKEGDSIFKEEEIIGEKWKGDKNNKIAHKSYLKYKIEDL
ncbi:Vacuolar protein sorting-associated protein 41 [Pichia californica]|nr:Vacuolar protein sorting-associated protein 41 [[Candida] californica]